MRNWIVVLTLVTVSLGNAGGAFALSYDAEVLIDNPKLYYRFEEGVGTGGTAVDSSPSAFNGTYLNQAIQVAGSAYPNLGASVEFDGADDSVEINHAIAGGATKSMSVEAWLYMDVNTGWRTILNHDGWATGYAHYQFNSNPLRWSINGDGGDTLFDAFTFNTNTWYHTVVTHDGSTSTDNVKLYVDGALVQTASKTNANNPVIAPGNIGAWNGNDREWDGKMDEFAIYDYVLDGTRVAAHYNATQNDGSITSAADGFWHVAGTWTGVPAPPTDLTLVTVGHGTLALPGTVTVDTGVGKEGFAKEVTINADNTVQVNGDLAVSSGVAVEAGAVLNVAAGGTFSAGAVGTEGAVSIDMGAGTTTINVDEIEAGAGTLAVTNGNFAIGDLVLAGATATFAADLDVASLTLEGSSLATADFGTLSVSGAVEITGGGSTLTLDQDLTVPTMDINNLGVLAFAAGTENLTVGSALTVSEGSNLNTADFGTLDTTGAAITVSDEFGASTLTADTQTVTAASITIRNGTAAVANGGAYVADAFLLEDTTVSFPITESGNRTSVTAEAGTVNINVNTSFAGDLTTSGGTATLAAGTTQAYTGATIVTGGQLNVDADVPGTLVVDVNGGILEINASLTTNGTAGTTDQLEHRGYHANNDGVYMDLDNNDGMMDTVTYPPFGTALLTDGPGGRGLDFNNDADFTDTGAIGQNDNYSNIFVGHLKAAHGAGTYSFRRENDDDAMGIWIDLNQNGIFESSTPGLGSDRGEQLQWDNDGGWKDVILAADKFYMFAVTHRESGGGSGVDVNMTTPIITAEETIKPTDADQLGMWWNGYLLSSTTVANGQLNVTTPNGELHTGSVIVGDSGVVNAGGLVDTPEIFINAGGLYNANVAGGAGSAGATIDINYTPMNPGRFSANIAGVLTGQTVNVAGILDVAADGAATGATINMLQGGYVKVSQQQTTVANFPVVTLVGRSALGFDLTNADWTPITGNVTLAIDAILAPSDHTQAGPPPVAPLPSRAEVVAQLGAGNGARLLQGIVTVADGTVYNLGDDTNTQNSIFKGGALGYWTDAGNLEATFNDVSEDAFDENTGLYLLMSVQDATINKNTELYSDSLNAEFRGVGTLQFAKTAPADLTAWPTGDVTEITRTGVYGDADFAGFNTTGQGIVRLQDDDSVPAGATLRVDKGVIDTRTEYVVDNGGTVIVGSLGGIYLDDNPGNSWGADNIREGHWVIEGGGVIMNDGSDSRMRLGTATWDISPDAYVFLRDNIVTQDIDPRITGGTQIELDNVNWIYQAGDIRRIAMGDGRRLTTPANAGAGTSGNNANAWIEKSVSNNPTGSYVIFSASGGAYNSNGVGGDTDINCAIDLVDVDIYINDPLGDPKIHLPTNENDMTRMAVMQDGRVNMDGSIIKANNIIVRNGYLRLASNERDVQTTITGYARIQDNAELQIYAGRGEGNDNGPSLDVTKIRYQVEHDTLFDNTQGGINVDQGGYLLLQYRGLDTASPAGGNQDEVQQGHTTAVPHVVLQTITVDNQGDVPGMGRLFSGFPMSILRFDEEAGDVNNDNHVLFPNIFMEGGAHVGISRANVDREELRLGVTIAGDALMERENEEWSFQDVEVDTPGAEYTLQVNRDGNGGQIDIYGEIGDGITLMGVDTTLDFNWGADMAPTAVATNLGSLTPGAAGSAGLVRAWTGSDGNNPITGGTFLIGGNEDAEVRVNDALLPDPQIVNNFGGTVKVMDDGTTTRDGLIRTQRGINLDDANDVPGKVVWNNVVLDGAAYAQIEGANGTEYNILNLDLGDGGRLQVQNNMSLDLNTIIGSGRIYNGTGGISVDTTIAPGTSAGTIDIDVDGGLEVDGTVTYNMELAWTDSDLVDVEDDLGLIDGWTLSVASLGRGTYATDHIPVFLYGGTLTADLAAANLTFDTAGTMSAWNTGSGTLVQDPATFPKGVYLTGISSPDLISVASTNWNLMATWDDLTVVPEMSSFIKIDDADEVFVDTLDESAFRIDLTSTGTVGLDVRASGSLVVTTQIDVGPSSTLNADGSLSAAVLNSEGTTTLTGGGNIGTLNVIGGTTSMSSPAVATINATGGILHTASTTMGDLTVDGGAVVTTGDAAAATVETISGSVTLTGGKLAAATARITGGTVDTAASFLQISQELKLGENRFKITGGSFQASGSDLFNEDVDRTITLTDPGSLISVGSGGTMPAGLLYHLDAAEDVTKDGSDRVSAWADQGDAGNDFLQANAGTQPLWVTDSIGGLPAIRFAGGQNNQEMLLNTPTAPQTFFAVTNVSQGGGLRGIWGSENADKGIRLNSNTDYRGPGQNTDGNDFANGDPDGVRVNGVVTTAYAVGTPHVINELRGPNFNATTFNVTSIGEYYANNRDYGGDVAELLAFDRILTAEELNDVGGYLADKYGLTTAYTGGIGAPSVELPSTHVVVSATATIDSLAVDVELGNLTV